MNEIIELLRSFGVDPVVAALGGGIGGVLVLYLALRKGKKSKKKKSSGGQVDYGDATTSGYDTRAGNFVDELNSDSVLTQDVQDFAVPNFNKEDLEKTTGTRGYKKKVFNAALPGMTFGDNRPMVPTMEDDLETSAAVELRAEMNSVTRSSVSGFGLKPKTVNQGMDISTITSSGLKILDDVEQLMRPAAPEKVSADSPLQKINAPMSLGGDVKKSNPSFDLSFDMDEPTKGQEKVVPKASNDMLEFESVNNVAENQKEEFVLDVSETNNIHSENIKLHMKLEEPTDSFDVFVAKASVPQMPDFNNGLSFEFTSTEKPSSAEDIDLSDIPGLNLAEVDNFSNAQSNVVEDVFTPSVVSKLDESVYPETIIYHQEIEAALFLDEEGMKDKALQKLENTLELINNVKVKFYFKLAIQSYRNKTGEKELAEIIRNFYDFEYEKYSK